MMMTKTKEKQKAYYRWSYSTYSTGSTGYELTHGRLTANHDAYDGGARVRGKRKRKMTL